MKKVIYLSKRKIMERQKKISRKKYEMGRNQTVKNKKKKKKMKIAKKQ